MAMVVVDARRLERQWADADFAGAALVRQGCSNDFTSRSSVLAPLPLPVAVRALAAGEEIRQGQFSVGIAATESPFCQVGSARRTYIRTTFAHATAFEDAPFSLGIGITERFAAQLALTGSSALKLP